ncbi:hypothetical protein [Pedobacter sp. Hv1]|uniref:hypothetical protein n=1 Tax=Pedobacter sp. Hv1 TaxID=1740090 RepID=UPI0006D8D188|nr:hypothetical protein [Pedobacter sp. Hv1]KQB99862.1 hypothetical protein AQF98_15205 [Pedobacter sp. Hv1]
MYRKIRSNPPANLAQELTKEFGKYFLYLGVFCKRIGNKYPHQLFALMLTSMLLSGILAFTVLRVSKAPPLPSLAASGTSPITQGFGQIIQSGQALKEVLDLQSQINTVLHKDSLGPADSLLLKNAIRRLEIINHQLNPK